MASIAAMATATPFHMLRIPHQQQLTRRNQTLSFRLQERHLNNVQHLLLRKTHKHFASTDALSTELEAISSDSAPTEGVSVASTTADSGQLKMKVDVSAAKSEAIFDNVFSKMVSAAQPIPGFRRAKGGKTPNIPRDVLIQIIGPSKVYKQVIKKIINSTVAEYVEKEKLNVTKDLQVEQSFEELESTFEPGKEFSFDVTLQLPKEDV